MTPLLLRHLATSVSSQVANISKISRIFPSPAASIYRSLYTLTTAPRVLFLSSRKTGSIQPPLPGSFGQCGQSLLQECQHLSCVQPSRGMKTKSALRRRCKDCFIVRRRGSLYVFCKTNPRHKQRQG